MQSTNASISIGITSLFSGTNLENTFVVSYNLFSERFLDAEFSPKNMDYVCL